MACRKAPDLGLIGPPAVMVRGPQVVHSPRLVACVARQRLHLHPSKGAPQHNILPKLARNHVSLHVKGLHLL